MNVSDKVYVLVNGITRNRVWEGIIQKGKYIDDRGVEHISVLLRRPDNPQGPFAHSHYVPAKYIFATRKEAEKIGFILKLKGGTQ